jgi:hypothetical protein
MGDLVDLNIQEFEHEISKDSEGESVTQHRIIEFSGSFFLVPFTP